MALSVGLVLDAGYTVTATPSRVVTHADVNQMTNAPSIFRPTMCCAVFTMTVSRAAAVSSLVPNASCRTADRLSRDSLASLFPKLLLNSQPG
jgi:hypothetical protein